MNAKAHDVDLSHSRRKIAKTSNAVEVWLLDDRNQGRQIVSVVRCSLVVDAQKHLSPRALLTALRIPTSPVGYLLSSPSLQDQLGGQLRTPLRDMSGSSLSSIGETSLSRGFTTAMGSP